MKNSVQINPTDGGSGADNTKVKNCGCQWNLKLGAQKVVKKSTKTSGGKVESSVEILETSGGKVEEEELDTK